MTVSLSRETLLPCPFCGESLIELGDHHGKWWGHRNSPGPCIASTMQIHDAQDAAEWNTRSSGWRDISTAPKDGRYIILFATDMYGANDPGGPAKRMGTGYWDDEFKRWLGSHFTTHFPPTHWQPLPKPPSIPIKD